MELSVTEESKTRLVLEIKGHEQTFCTLLAKELYVDKEVTVAAYVQQHPLAGTPQLIVESSGKSPREAIEAALKRLRSKFEEFKKLCEKEFK